MNLKNKKKYHTVYRWTNKVNGRHYTGYHGTDNLDDRYEGSSHNWEFWRDKKHHEFEREILHIFDNEEDALDCEWLLVDTADQNPMSYNLTEGGGKPPSFRGKKRRPESTQKSLENRKKNGWFKNPEETSRNISEAAKKAPQDTAARKEGHRKRMEILQAKYSDPYGDLRKRISEGTKEGSKKYWEEYRSNPELQRQGSERSRKGWETRRMNQR